MDHFACACVGDRNPIQYNPSLESRPIRILINRRGLEASRTPTTVCLELIFAESAFNKTCLFTGELELLLLKLTVEG